MSRSVLNLDWNVSDKLNLRFDIASSEAESGGNGPLGNNVLRMNVAGATAGWQAVDFGQEIPQGVASIDDYSHRVNEMAFLICQMLVLRLLSSLNLTR